MTALILAKLAPYLAGLAAIIGALFMAKRAGRKDAKRETALEAAERYAKTRKRMDEASTGTDDTGILRDWLKERAERGRGAH
jgi:hypothetical protein